MIAAPRTAGRPNARLASRAWSGCVFAEDAKPPANLAPPASDGSAAIFAAQVIGQTGQRRGLKGGPPVLDAARSAYLGAEYSGAGERRPKPGRTEDTDI